MEPLFYSKIFLSFLVGGIWIALTTVAAERLGSKSGGFIGGLPSTAVVALFFIGLTQDPLAAAEATTLIPFVQGINGVFLLLFALTAKHGALFAFITALPAWFVLTGALAASGIRTFPLSVSAWIILAVGSYLLVEQRMTIPSQRRLTLSATKLQILFRAVFGGGMIVLAVLVSRLSGPVYGGIFAAFPAMFVSTLIVTHRSGGAPFSRAVAKSLLFSGMVNIPVYAILVRYSYPLAGLLAGTFLAFAITSGVAYLTYRVMIVPSS